MLYSHELLALFKSKKIEVGYRIQVQKNNVNYEGILMPRIKAGDQTTVVIKLDNGYNIGIKYEKDVKVKLLARGKPIKFKPAELSLKKDPGKPTVSILGCGGTIASRVEYKTGGVFPAFSPGDLLLAFPKLQNLANIEGRKLFDLWSEDITTEHWKIIAKEVAKEINQDKVDGVVLMSGTDFLHYTSAALNFALQNLPVPVVVTGAQRSSDRGSSDNEMNLLSSVATATSDIAQVTVCMHAGHSDDFCYVHSGVKVRKLHTSTRDAFKSVNVLPFAKVLQNTKIDFIRNDFSRRSKGKVKVDDKFNPNVTLIYTYPGIKPEFVRSLSNYDGIVIAVSGIGQVPTGSHGDKFAKSLIPTIKSLIDSGIPIVATPQTIYGRLNLNVYDAGRMLNETGVIGNGCDWTPDTALVKLMWVLGHTKNMNKVREMMLTNIAGEISERTMVLI